MSSQNIYIAVHRIAMDEDLRSGNLTMSWQCNPFPSQLSFTILGPHASRPRSPDAPRELESCFPPEAKSRLEKTAEFEQLNNNLTVMGESIIMLNARLE